MMIHIPQLYTSCKTKGKGLSPIMLGLWWISDVSGMVGLRLNHNTGIMLVTQTYYLCMDSLLVLQYLYFHHLTACFGAPKNQDVALVDLATNNSINSGSRSSNVDSFSPNDSRKVPTVRNLRSGPALIALSTCVIALAMTPVGEATRLAGVQFGSQLAQNVHDYIPTSVADIASDVAQFITTGEIPPCRPIAKVTNLIRIIGVSLGIVCCTINSLSKIPQMYYQYRRKSTYGLSSIFLALNTLTPFTYAASILIPTRTYDNSNGYRTTAFWLEIFPYLFVTVCSFLSNVVIYYQVYMYKEGTEKERRENEQKSDEYVQLND
jgi:uncharacterized protein with PQ loop repeat